MRNKIKAIIVCAIVTGILTSGGSTDSSESIGADSKTTRATSRFVMSSTSVQAAKTYNTFEETVVSTETVQSVPSKISLGEFKLTAYCACIKCCGKTDAITASGVKAVAGTTIAADTSILPFETRVLIDDHEYTVQDRGGSIKGNRIDIYFNTHQEALNFGVRHKDVYKIK